ncbi:hypothetical protein, partial [Sinorhizobium medicae]
NQKQTPSKKAPIRGLFALLIHLNLGSERVRNVPVDVSRSQSIYAVQKGRDDPLRKVSGLGFIPSIKRTTRENSGRRPSAPARPLNRESKLQDHSFRAFQLG